MNLGAAPVEASRGLRLVKAQGDAFETLFRAEYARCVRIADRVLVDRAEAEDVVQEIFIAFHGRHAPDADFAAAWLHQAAAHAALNRLRGRRRRERREIDQAVESTAKSVDPADVMETNEQRKALHEALGRMPAKPAAVLVLRSSGLSYREVAKALGVGIGQVGTLLRRAEQALRKEVSRGSSV
jgi:RNA polymerase sigma factor (sigma-70 family)